MQAQRLEKLPRHINNLGIKGRVTVPDSLTAKLVVLSHPPRLGPFIPENGGKII